MGCMGYHTTYPMFNLLANLPNINSPRQRCVVDKARGKSFLSANWDRMKSVCQKIGVVHPTKNFRHYRSCLLQCIFNAQLPI